MMLLHHMRSKIITLLLLDFTVLRHYVHHVEQLLHGPSLQNLRDLEILTTRFIVDSYYYVNYRTTDYTCCKWCNPAPLNGSAPNLVVVESDIHGRPHHKRAFNTQACEQLNAWLGGFQNMLNRMTFINFNWTIHALLFIYTQKVIKKQLERNNSTQDDDYSKNMHI
ncbi:hypothetical protein BDQ17DRAFT_1393270 [Cyathus striatus]|nr:hypothetical protein BDQ17DRAFT_1393270 [Cyathus striatus]